jgi:uncharacterized protein YbjT (DUF2867 family)
MITITGATGNVGSKIADQLLSKGQEITVIGRNAEKLKAFENRGAKLQVGDIGDTEFLAKAFKGSDVVFSVLPPNQQAEDIRAYYNRMGESIATAIEKAGVKKVVQLSSQGGELDEGTGPVLGLHDQEERLNAMEDVDVMVLRPTYFMENLIWNFDMIASEGINGGTFDPDRKFHMIATKDIAKAAVEHLKSPDFKGNNVRDLLGAGAIDMDEITKLIGKELGNDRLPYIQFPYESAEKGMIGSGLSPSVAASYMELNRHINAGKVASHEKPLTDENRTETSFQEFAKVFGDMWKARQKE